MSDEHTTLPLKGCHYLFISGFHHGGENSDEVLIDHLRDFDRDTGNVGFNITDANVRADTWRFLFGDFPHLKNVILCRANCVGDDLGVLAAQALRGKPLQTFIMDECNLGRAGLRDLLHLAESTPGMKKFGLSMIGRAWEREEALFAARLVETTRITRFTFRSETVAAWQAAVNRAAERARIPQDIGEDALELVRARNSVLALLAKGESAVSRFLAKDGDHAVLFRVLALLGGNVVFDATTAEEAYDACVLRM